MNIKALANTYILFALVLGALVPVMLGLAGSINIYEYLFLTYLVAVPTSFMFVIASGKKKKLVSYFKNKRDLAIVAFIGVLNYASMEYGMTYAEHFISTSLATVIYRMNPILMLAFLPFILKERVTKYQGIALSLAFIGLYIAISMSGGATGLSKGTSFPIIAFMAMVAVAGALATVLAKKYTYDVECSMFIFNLANFAVFLSLFLLNGPQFGGITMTSLLAILYVGVVYNVFVGFMYYGALRMLKTTFVTNLSFLSPFITILFAHLILGEAILPYYLAVAGLVAAGILIQKFDKKGGSYLPSKSHDLNRITLFDVTGAFLNTTETAISDTIRDGGRVLAVKVPQKHREKAEALLEANEYTNVFTHEHPTISDESKFVKDILGAEEGSLVIMKAGRPEESEEFFGKVSTAIGAEEA